MNNQSRDRTGKYGFSGDYGRICKCGHNLGTHTAEPPHICGSNGTGLVDCACMKFVPTPPPEESTLRENKLEIMAIFGPDQLEQKNLKFNDGKKQLQFEIVEQLIQERERLARIELLDEIIDINSAQFMKWSQKDIAHFFERVGIIYRNLESKQAVKVKAVKT